MLFITCCGHRKSVYLSLSVYLLEFYLRAGFARWGHRVYFDSADKQANQRVRLLPLSSFLPGGGAEVRSSFPGAGPLLLCVLPLLLGCWGTRATLSLNQPTNQPPPFPPPSAPTKPCPETGPSGPLSADEVMATHQPIILLHAFAFASIHGRTDLMISQAQTCKSVQVEAYRKRPDSCTLIYCIPWWVVNVFDLLCSTVILTWLVGYIFGTVGALPLQGNVFSNNHAARLNENMLLAADRKDL